MHVDAWQRTATLYGQRRMSTHYTADAKLYATYSVVVNGHNCVAVRRRTVTDGNATQHAAACCVRHRTRHSVYDRCGRSQRAHL